MRKIKEVLRLKASGLSNRKIARICSIGRSTVADYVSRAKAAGLSWPLPEDMEDERLEQQFFPLPDHTFKERPRPDWSKIHEELKRKGVTLVLLWEEYKARHPEGYQYSQFCELYRKGFQ